MPATLGRFDDPISLAPATICVVTVTVRYGHEHARCGCLKQFWRILRTAGVPVRRGRVASFTANSPWGDAADAWETEDEGMTVAVAEHAFSRTGFISSVATPDRPRLALFVHGRGRGHAARAAPVARVLASARIDVRLYAGGAASAALRDLNPQSIECFGPGPALLRRFATRLRSDVAELSRLRPSVVVTDGDAPSLHAARLLGIPSIAVGHGLAFAYADLGELPPRWQIREAANALSSSYLADRRIAVHFGPAVPKFPSVRVAHAFADDVAPAPTCAGPTVAYFREAPPRALLRSLVASGCTLVLFSTIDPQVPGVIVRPPEREGFALALADARGIVGSAGSNLCAEAIQLGIPMLAAYRGDDYEQALNAHMLHALGIGHVVPDGDPLPDVVERFVAAASSGVRRLEARRLAPSTSVAVAVLEAVRELMGQGTPPPIREPRRRISH